MRTLPLLTLALLACGGSTKPAATPAPAAETAPAVTGAYDKNVIRGEVRSHLPQVEYCYQKELQHNPLLAGTVTVSFTIQPDGSTVVDGITGFENTSVPACISELFAGMKFPAPEGGGVVKVTSYPFTFRPALGLRSQDSSHLAGISAGGLRRNRPTCSSPQSSRAS